MKTETNIQPSIEDYREFALKQITNAVYKIKAWEKIIDETKDKNVIIKLSNLLTQINKK